MYDLEPVKVCHTRHDLRELKAMGEQGRKPQNNNELTSRKRFASGWNFAYSITFPLGIHSVIMRKQRGSTDTEAPNKGKMFGWDKCFQPMISRHNRWLEIEQR